MYLPEKGRYKVILEGKNLGALIGRRGETLDAIQQLTSYSVNRSGGGRVRVQLDAENYRRPKSAAPSKLLEPWYQVKSFTISHQEKLTDELFSREIVGRLRSGYAFLLPYYDYFVTLDGEPDPRETP